jgi:hypothetical protein
MTAQKLMAVYQKLNASLNELRRRLGEVMQSVWLELMPPIVRQHPDLDPDKQGLAPEGGAMKKTWSVPDFGFRGARARRQACCCRPA